MEVFSYVKKYDNKPFIVLTSPHAFCKKNSSNRTCDIKAKKATNFISEILTKLKVNHIVHKNDTLRGSGEFDMNRIQSRYSNYRIKLTNYIENNSIIFNLDIHSYWQHENNDLYIIDEEGYPVIYSIRFKKSLEIGLGKLFKRGFIKFGPIACLRKYKTLSEAIGKCVNNNDIQNQFRLAGIHSILVEFYEKLSDKNLLILCKHISFWLYKEYNTSNITIEDMKKIFGKEFKKYSKVYNIKL